MKENDVKTELEEKDGWTRQEDAARVVDLADPTRGDDPNEFQGHHLGAGVSLIVVDAPPGKRKKVLVKSILLLRYVSL